MELKRTARQSIRSGMAVLLLFFIKESMRLTIFIYMKPIWLHNSIFISYPGRSPDTQGTSAARS